MSLLSRFALQGASGAPGQTYWYAEFTNTQDVNPVFNENPIVYVQPGTGDIAVALGSGNDKAILAKIDADANVLWSRFFTNAGSPYYVRIEKISSTYIDDSGNSYFFGQGNDSTYPSREAQMVVIDPSNNVTLNVMPCDNGMFQSDEIHGAVPVGSNFATLQGTSAIHTLINSSGVIQDRHDNCTITGTPDGTITSQEQNRADKRIVVDDSLIWVYGYVGNFSSIFTYNKSNFTKANGYYLKSGSANLRGRSIAVSSDGTKQAFTHTYISGSNYYDCVSFGSLSGGLTGYRSNNSFGANRNNFVAFDDDNNVYWCFVGPYNNPITTNYLFKFDVTSGNILFQREFVVDGTNGGAQVNSMTLENDSLHIVFGKGSNSYYSSMIKVPLNGSGTGTYGNQIPITYQESVYATEDLPLLNVTVNGPYSFTTQKPTLGNFNLNATGMIQTTGIYSNSRLDEILKTPASTAAISQNVTQSFITTGSNVDTERTVNANTGDLIIDQTFWGQDQASPNVLMGSGVPGTPDQPTELSTDTPSGGAGAGYMTSYYKYSDMATDAEVWRWNQAITNQRNYRFTLTIPSAQYVTYTTQIRVSTTGWTPPSIPNLLAGDKVAITQVHFDPSTQLFDATQTDPNLESYNTATVTRYLSDTYPLINAIAVVPSNGTYQLPTFSYAGDYNTDNFNIMIHAVVFRAN